MNVFMVNAIENYIPVPGVTHADEAIGAAAAGLSVALNANTEMVMLQPEKTILVTFDGTDPAKAVAEPAAPAHGLTYSAGVPFIVNRTMAIAMKWVCAVAEETGRITVQEMTR